MQETFNGTYMNTVDNLTVFKYNKFVLYHYIIIIQIWLYFMFTEVVQNTWPTTSVIFSLEVLPSIFCTAPKSWYIGFVLLLELALWCKILVLTISGYIHTDS